MIHYQYLAVNAKGKNVKGVIMADSPRTARLELKQKGLLVISLSAEKKRNKSWLTFGKTFSALELSLLTRQFAILLDSGLSVADTLNSLAEQLNDSKQKSVILKVRNEVLSGRSLAQSLQSYPKVFPPIYSSLVNAGEQSGSLALVMMKLADYNDKSRALAGKVLMALLYPMIISIVAVLMIVGLLVFVVPQVVQVFQSANQQLPLVTTILIDVSGFVRSYGWIVLILLILFGLVFSYLLKQHKFKLAWNYQTLKFPVIGKILINSNVSRFVNTMSLLLASGVNMISALEASRDTMSNYRLKVAVDNSLKLVKEGTPLAVALSKEKVFPQIIVHLIASGEKSGNLEHLLAQAGAQQELELSHRSQLLTGIMEPAMILIMAGIVLFIVVAIMLPILDLNSLVTQ